MLKDLIVRRDINIRLVSFFLFLFSLSDVKISGISSIFAY